MNNEWGFAKVWNESLENREERPIQARNRLWASELGKSPIDIYLKLKGEVPTNPPNARSLRKFEAGNIFEWIVELILQRAGILQDAQRWTAYKYPGLLEVSGKLDFIAGGKPDYEKAKVEIDKLDLPDVFTRAGNAILDYFSTKYPEGLEPKILEVKSVSAFMFDNLERNNGSSQNHRIQLFHYLKAENMEKGMIVYICRDDCRMMEIPIHNPSVVEDEYKGSIEELSKYYYADEQPPLEKSIVYDEDIGKFSKNWKVAYSMYLTKLYGFKDQAEFDDAFSGKAERWNRVLGRMREGKKITEKNEQALAEIEEAGFDLKDIINAKD